VEEPHENHFWKLQHEPAKLSQIGFEANYVPPGHYNNKTVADFRSIGKDKYTKWVPGAKMN
jgi:hypothetical protein